MKPRAWDTDRLHRLDEVLAGYVERGDVVGLTWQVARGGDVHAGAAGTLRAGVAGDGGDATGTPAGAVGRDTIYRISSTTKPITAVAALMLVEDCVLRLDDPVDDLLPELADRRVLADPEGPLEDTVPAERSITAARPADLPLGPGLGLHRVRPAARDDRPVRAGARRRPTRATAAAGAR